MACLVPELSFEIVAGLLGLLVVDTNDIIAACSCKISSVVCVVNRKDLIVRLNSMPQLFAGLGENLEDMAIGIGSQKNRSYRL